MYTEYLRERSPVYLDMNFMVHIYSLYAELENNFVMFVTLRPGVEFST